MNKIERVVCWFSCGVTSAIATKLTLEKYKNVYPVEVVYCDTGSEHDDNFRFLQDVEKWLNIKIKILKSEEYEDTFDVYRKTRFIVGPGFARCSIELKKAVRQAYENIESDLQIFGYDYTEIRRMEKFIKNNPEYMLEFPLIDNKLTKNDCHKILEENEIKRPLTYDLGFHNANCLKRGCVKGGTGYWNHYRKVFPEKFDEMAKLEREIGTPFSKVQIKKKRGYVFLDELPEDVGIHHPEEIYNCGLFCGQNEELDEDYNYE